MNHDYYGVIDKYTILVLVHRKFTTYIYITYVIYKSWLVGVFDKHTTRV